jgi:hypothetical protein
LHKQFVECESEGSDGLLLVDADGTERQVQSRASYMTGLSRGYTGIQDIEEEDGADRDSGIYNYD